MLDTQSLNLSIAGRLKELRLSLGLTHEKIATMCDVNKNTYAKYERGDNPIPLPALFALQNSICMEGSDNIEASNKIVAGLLGIEAAEPKASLKIAFGLLDTLFDATEGSTFEIGPNRTRVTKDRLKTFVEFADANARAKGSNFSDELSAIQALMTA